MRAQGLDRRVVAGQFRLAERGVDLVVANLVQKHGGTALAAAQFRHKVMPALRDTGRDRPVAQWADGDFPVGQNARHGREDCSSRPAGASGSG